MQKRENSGKMVRVVSSAIATTLSIFQIFSSLVNRNKNRFFFIDFSNRKKYGFLSIKVLLCWGIGSDRPHSANRRVEQTTAVLPEPVHLPCQCP